MPHNHIYCIAQEFRDVIRIIGPQQHLHGEGASEAVWMHVRDTSPVSEFQDHLPANVQAQTPPAN